MYAAQFVFLYFVLFGTSRVSEGYSPPSRTSAITLTRRRCYSGSRSDQRGQTRRLQAEGVYISHAIDIAKIEVRANELRATVDTLTFVLSKAPPCWTVDVVVLYICSS